jgi:hypothetical protein
MCLYSDPNTAQGLELISPVKWNHSLDQIALLQPGVTKTMVTWLPPTTGLRLVCILNWGISIFFDSSTYKDIQNDEFHSVMLKENDYFCCSARDGMLAKCSAMSYTRNKKITFLGFLYREIC